MTQILFNFSRVIHADKAKAIDEQDVKSFLEFMKENNFSQILAHAPYTLNACSNKEETREFALNTMADDLRRMEYTPNQLYNFHPGSHVGQGVEIGIDFIVKQLNTVLTPDMTTTVLLETMAGKGTEIGRSFEEKIGEGSIGFDTMVKIINHPKLQGIPILLETPNELDGYKKEIQMLRKSYTM